jgi:hypothetical protein
LLTLKALARHWIPAFAGMTVRRPVESATELEHLSSRNIPQYLTLAGMSSLDYPTLIYTEI